jgi:hypothetical protein
MFFQVYFCRIILNYLIYTIGITYQSSIIYLQLNPDYALENLLRAETSSKQNALPLLKAVKYFSTTKALIVKVEKK